MLASPHTNSWGFVYTNQANGSATPGQAVTPGTSSSEGNWLEIAPDASITTDIYEVALVIYGGATSGQAKNHFLDFGWDPAGGTSYVAFLSNFACGSSVPIASTAAMGGAFLKFPVLMPAGSAGAVRIQGSNGTAGTVTVLAYFFGKPSRPEMVRPAAYSETLGAGASTLGTSFTPGEVSWGAWASLGTTTKKHHRAQLGVQVDNATMTGEAAHLQLGIGDGTNMHVICDQHMRTTTTERISHFPSFSDAWEIPAGAELWVRGNTDGAPATGYNATAVLFGG